MKNKILIILIGLIATLYANDKLYKAYGVPKAVIDYNIYGEGEITQTTHINIIGSATLIFIDWGAKKLYKENYTKTSRGTIVSREDRQSLTLEDYGTIYEVNFDKNMIEKREDNIIKDAIKGGKDISSQSVEGWKRLGNSNIMGFRCQEFQKGNQKRCLYKGVVLKEKMDIDGVVMVKEAVSIDFNRDITDEYFELPTFQKSDSKGFIAIDSRKSSLELFKRQKELLPQLLVEMQEARVCLENAEDRVEANICLDSVIKIKSIMSGIEDNGCIVTRWRDIQKEERLEKLESKILALKQKMPCIRRSRNIDDLSECMEDRVVE